ncbi:hypothetical protein V6N11_039727 [Hibiscus sabdariffa]|uniref:Uncharacterized protein n=2 Tax=Hibiscus sabdariffa TaxID=183260 RepID=A0ABR2NFL5_9ROSI
MGSEGMNNEQDEASDKCMDNDVNKSKGNDEDDVQLVPESATMHEDKLVGVDCEEETKGLGKEGDHEVTGIGNKVGFTQELVSEPTLQYDVVRDGPSLSNEGSKVEVINYMGNRRKVRQIVDVIHSLLSPDEGIQTAKQQHKTG